MENVKIPLADPHVLRENKLTLAERLADDLAHEIKNPLHSMVINLEVLKRRVNRWSGADATELLRYVGILSGELDRVTRRVDLLLRMVRPDRGGEPVSLGETVRDLLELVQLERERHGIEIDLRSGDEPPIGHLPRESARQIVLNLLLLGIDAASPNGQIVITPRVEGKQEILHLRAVPGEGGDRGLEGWVGEEGAARATVTALAESLAGRFEFAAGLTTDIVVAIPLGRP